MSLPPSCLLKEFHQSLNGKEPSESMLDGIAKIWLQHLSTVDANRKRGAAKAAQTRRLKKQQQSSAMFLDQFGIKEFIFDVIV